MSLESLQDSKIVDAIDFGGVAFAQPPSNRCHASGIRRNGHYAINWSPDENSFTALPQGAQDLFFKDCHFSNICRFC